METRTVTQPAFGAALREAVAALDVPGIAERWAAVQEQLHPLLAALAEQLAANAAQHFPQWPLYEVSYKSLRYVNRGRGVRSPIDEYHVAFDRPPRGAGVLISVSGAERAVLVGLQLWGVRKNDLRRVWNTGRTIWHPLITQIAHQGEARFSRSDRTRTRPAPQEPTWMDDYLAARNASYLWAGFVYPWDTLPDTLDTQLVAHTLALLPLNEALMEQAETPDPTGAALLREHQAAYTTWTEYPSIERIIEHIQSRGFTGSDTLLRSYHVALQTRPLVILPGISGTGKTRLTRLYADAVHSIATPTHTNPYYLRVAVQPDWHSARDILGYYNALSGHYHPTPLLHFLMRAAADPQQPYFVCLDEMNLSRPEYYLAPILSALETSDQSLDLGAPTEEIVTVSGETLRNPFRLPRNVAITGTVNVDETTHPLSDKVLDRANVIELTDVDLPGFRATYDGPIDDEAWHTIVQIHALATQAGRPFGYRTLTNMLRTLEQAAGILPPQQALDLQMKQNVLPKLRGEDTPPLRQALGDMLALFHERGLPESAEKVRRMRERLIHEGFTDFYG